eukprot:SAG31_NODE_4194_length_3486_cov_1.765870_6_plen_124_part_01
MLRAAELGEEEVLKALLAQPGLDVAMVTTDYKLVLGQHIPQYEAGGRSALLLAIEALRPGTVDILLAHPLACAKLLHTPDSFDRSPIQAAFESAALRRVGSTARADAEKICESLHSALMGETVA